MKTTKLELASQMLWCVLPILMWRLYGTGWEVVCLAGFLLVSFLAHKIVENRQAGTITVGNSENDPCQDETGASAAVRPGADHKSGDREQRR